MYLVVTHEPTPSRGDAFDPECPTRVVLDRIGDKWTVLVISALEGGSLRFSELRARIGGVAAKVLTQTLRTMERDGLVTRHRDTGDRRAVRVELTEAGEALHAELLRAVIAFNRRLRRGLAEHDIAQLRELLDRLAANVG